MAENTFTNTLVNFFSEVKTEFPEYEHQVKKCYKSFTNTPIDDYVLKTRALMKPYVKQIAKSDSSLFELEKEKIKLVHGLDFKIIWNEHSDKFGFLWSYLQRLYVAMYKYGEENDWQFEASEKKYYKVMIENIRFDFAILAEAERLDKKENSEGTGPAGLEGMLEGLSSVLGGEDNMIANLAKELASDILPEMTEDGDPQQFLASLLSGEKMNEFVETIQNKLQKKMESGEIDKETFEKDAQKLSETMQAHAGGNPIFAQMKEMMTNNQEELDMDGFTKYFQEMSTDLMNGNKLDEEQRKEMESSLGKLTEQLKNMKPEDINNKSIIEQLEKIQTESARKNLEK